jgi:hypothetical protein
LSNVVSVSFAKTSHQLLSSEESRVFARTELQDNVSGSNVIPLPLRTEPSHSSLSFAHRKTLRGTFAWASEVVAADRRLSFAVVETRKRLNRLVRETCPKPVFTPAGDGYERVTSIQARQILTFRAANLGPEEYKLAVSLETYDDARTKWEAARKQLSVSCGLALLAQQWNEIREDARQAYAILREVGADPWHH